MRWNNNLRKVREKANMTQEELEKASGVSRVTISNIERGVSQDIKINTMLALANALNEKVENIFLA